MDKQKVIDELIPLLPGMCLYMGMELHQAQDYIEAEKWYHRSLTLDGTNPRALEAMMYASIAQKKYTQGIDVATGLMEATAGTGVAVAAQYNRGLMYLANGDYIHGFEDYDTRMRMGQTEDILRKKIGTRPMWDGKPCDHLLVYGEQGMGDLFMFCRYILVLCESNLAKRITFEVPKEMLYFMLVNFPFIDVVPQTEEITKSDEHVLLVSLARIFKTTLDTIPISQDRYLSAPVSFVDKWERISRLPNYKIGLCWAGRSVENQDPQVAEWNGRRSITLKQLAPFLNRAPERDGISFISLQKGIDEAQLADFPFIHDFSDQIENWSDTAGIMSHLDCVVSIDSGPVHLAGAMGYNTLLLNHASGCWRWRNGGDRSLWYDSVRIIEQKKDYVWDDVVENLRTMRFLRISA
jgi:hypothetical protein